MRFARSPQVFVLVTVLLLTGSACREERPEPRLETHRTIPSEGESRAIVTIKIYFTRFCIFTDPTTLFIAT